MKAVTKPRPAAKASAKVGKTASKPAPKAPDAALHLRVVVTNPLPGVAYAVQRGRDDIEQIQIAGDRDLAFTVPVETRVSKDGSPDTKGPHVQGPLGGRFVYITSGVRAGQHHSRWDRRAKIPLAGVAELASQDASKAITLEVRIDGRMRDGGPMCASVKLPGGWKRVAK